MKLLIKNGLIADGVNEPEIMDILAEDGMIIEIAKGIPVSGMMEVINAAGNYVIPGLVDMYAEIGEPGYENREDLQSATRSAAKGAYTSITCQPRTDPVIDNKTVVSYVINKAARHGIVNVFPYGEMTRGGLGREIAEIGEMYAEGIVAVSDGGESVGDAGLMLNILSYCRMFDMPVITTCEDKCLAGDGVVNEGYMSAAIGLKGIPYQAEDVMVARNILLAKDITDRLHIANVSTKGAVSMIRRQKADGMKLTCSTNPHYFSLTEDAVESYNTFVKVKPPLRAREDMKAVLEGIADGTIDVISSGHSPSPVESKQLEFDRASYGISSLETAFAISYTNLVRTGKISINQLVRSMSTTPARILGLENKGGIKRGFDADLCVVSKDESYKINGADFASRAKYTPYQGMEVWGKVLYTFVGGRIVYLD